MLFSKVLFWVAFDFVKLVGGGGIFVGVTKV